MLQKPQKLILNNIQQYKEVPTKAPSRQVA